MSGKRAFWLSTIWGIALGLLMWMPGSVSAQSLTVWDTPEYQNGWQLGAVDAAQAYARGYTGQGVAVGVLDSGLDTRHPEFIGRLLDGYDFSGHFPITGEGDFDTDMHGTHVSGIIAANRDGEGMHGVAFSAKLLPAVLNQKSLDQDAVFADAWRFLADQGVSIINNSLGINDCSQAIIPPCTLTTL